MYSCKTHRQESARGVLKLVFLYSLTFLVQGSAQQCEHQKDGGDGFMIVQEPVSPNQSLEHVSDTLRSNHQYTKPIQPSNSSFYLFFWANLSASTFIQKLHFFFSCFHMSFFMLLHYSFLYMWDICQNVKPEQQSFVSKKTNTYSMYKSKTINFVKLTILLY